MVSSEQTHEIDTFLNFHVLLVHGRQIFLMWLKRMRCGVGSRNYLLYKQENFSIIVTQSEEVKTEG